MTLLRRMSVLVGIGKDLGGRFSSMTTNFGASKFWACSSRTAESTPLWGGGLSDCRDAVPAGPRSICVIKGLRSRFGTEGMKAKANGGVCGLSIRGVHLSPRGQTMRGGNVKEGGRGPAAYRNDMAN